MYEMGVNPRLSWDSNKENDIGWAPGQVAFTDEGSGWICFEANEAISRYDVVVLDGSFVGRRVTAAVLTARLAGPCGGAGGDVPSGYFGWIQIFGAGFIQLAGGVSQGDDLYTSATAGALDDSSTGQTRVHRMAAYTSPSGAGVVGVFYKWPSGTD